MTAVHRVFRALIERWCAIKTEDRPTITEIIAALEAIAAQVLCGIGPTARSRYVAQVVSPFVGVDEAKADELAEPEDNAVYVDDEDKPKPIAAGDDANGAQLAEDDGDSDSKAKDGKGPLHTRSTIAVGAVAD